MDRRTLETLEKINELLCFALESASLYDSLSLGCEYHMGRIDALEAIEDFIKS